MSQHDQNNNFIAPDGGWGWMICIAVGISNMAVHSPMKQFGLIYKAKLAQLQITSTQITTIINTQYGVSSCIGLFNGPMFKRFSFRQVGFLGGVFVIIGVFSSAWCTTFVSYLLTYSTIYGFGMGLTMSSGSLALNTYFRKRRSIATGFSTSITGFGSIVFPYLVVFLLNFYGYMGTVFIFSGITMHALVSAILYQPVQRHSKTSILIADENTPLVHRHSYSYNEIQKSQSFLKKFISDLDLPLLKDFTFVNLLFGLTIIIFGEVNFSALVPFILSDVGFDDGTISFAMSLMAIVDVLVRFTGPFVTQSFSFSDKFNFAIGVVIITAGRMMVAFSSSYTVILCSFALVGFGKAFRTIYNPLIIAGYVPLKRYAAASGLQLVCTALFAFSFGPIIGGIKAKWGYSVTIHVINGLSIIGLTSWGLEAVYWKYGDFRQNL
ncbi:hypothetical protein ACFFRR_003339 [Megaselia abdita]